MDISESGKLEEMQKMSSKMANLAVDLMKVDNAGLPTGELEERAAGLILEFIELSPDLTPVEKSSIRKEVERYGIRKVIKDLGNLYNQ